VKKIIMAIIKILSVGVLLLVMISIYFASGYIGKDTARSIYTPSQATTQNNETRVQQGLIKAAEEINKTTPQMLSDSLRLDKAEENITDLSLTYYATFINLSSKDSDFSFLQDNLPKAISFTCSEMKWTISRGASYIHVYRGSDGIEVAKFLINKSDCK